MKMNIRAELYNLGDPEDENVDQKKTEATEERAMRVMVQYPRVSEYFSYMKKFFQQPLQKLAFYKTQDQKHLMDKFLPIDILRMFNGLEIHNLNKAFSKFNNEISLETFIIVGFRILDIPKEDSPYVLLGLMNLYHALTTQKGKQTLNFKDFLVNFIKVQSMFSEHKSYVDDENKIVRFGPSTIQDNTHHDTPIKNAFYSKSLKVFFVLDEASDFIRIYSSVAEPRGKIQPDKKVHSKRSIMIIMNIAWSEKRKKLGVCYQDLSVGFFSYEDNFSREECFSTQTLQTDIWYTEFCDYWFTTDTLYSLYYMDGDHNHHKVNYKFGSKISYVQEIAKLGLVGIASYDRKIVFYNPLKNSLALTINMEDCSAHTLKCAKEHDLFFAASYGHVIRVYQIDKARDYTKIGKLESPASITGVEVFEDQNMILTCDDEGHLKSWDYRNLKTLQHQMVHSNCPVSKIIHVEGTGRFCLVTNRLNFYEFGQVKLNNEKDNQAIAHMEYHPEKEEIIVALNNDIRVFSIRYGILSEIYDKELYNIGDTRKVVYFKKSKQTDHTFYVDQKGLIRQIMFSTNTKANQGFQPFQTDNSNFIYDEKSNLLVTWQKNNLIIYRYEISSHTNLVLKSIALPEPYQFTSVKVYKEKQVLVTVLNYSLVIFWGFHKLDVCGVYINCDPTFKIELEDSMEASEGSLELRTPVRSPFQFSSWKKENTFSGHTSPAASNQTKRKQMEDIRSASKSKRWEKNNNKEKEMSTDSIQTKSAKDLGQLFQPTTEVMDIHFIEDYNCFLLVDGKYDLFLVEQNSFEDFSFKIKINIQYKTQFADLSYTKIKVKPINFKPLLQDKVLNSKEIEHLYFESNEPNSDQDLQYLVFICTSEQQIIAFNINQALSQYFKHSKNDGKIKQPFYSSKVEFTETNIQNLVDKANQNNNKVSNLIPVYDVSTSKMALWKTGDNAILNMKVIIFNTILVVTLNQNSLLRLWNIKGELVGQLNIKETKKTIWNINQYNNQQRVEMMQKAKSLFEEVYLYSQQDMRENIDKSPISKLEDYSEKELKENGSYVSFKKNSAENSFVKFNLLKKKIEDVNHQSQPPILNLNSNSNNATLKAQYVLDRDKRLLVKKNEYHLFQNGTNKNEETKAEEPKVVKKHDNGTTSYLQSLSKKLNEKLTNSSENAEHERKHRPKRYNTQKSNLLKFEKDLISAASQKYLEARQEVKPMMKKESKNSKKEDLRVVTEMDYLNIYTHSLQNDDSPTSAYVSTEANYKSPRLDDYFSKNHSIRSVKRSNLLKDLETRMKKIKNGSNPIDVKKALVNISHNMKESERSKFYGKHLHGQEEPSFRSIHGLSTIEALNQPTLNKLPSINASTQSKASVLDEMSFEREKNQSKEFSHYISPIYKTKKRENRTNLSYDPKLDQEIIDKMSALDRITRKVHPAPKNSYHIKVNQEVSQEIDNIKDSRIKSLQRYYLSPSHHE